MKKRLIVVSILFLLLFIIFTQGEENEKVTKIEKLPPDEEVEKVTQAIAEEMPGIHEVQNPITVTGSDVGDFQVSPPATVTTSSEGASFSQLDQGIAKSGVRLENGNDVLLQKNGSVVAERLDYFDKPGQFQMRNIQGLRYDPGNGLILMRSGKDVVFRKPYMVTFDEVKNAWFKLDNDGNLLEWRVQFPQRTGYLIKNPFASGLQPKDTTVPKVILPNVGAAVNVFSMASLMNFSEGIDDYFIIRGNMDEFFSGNNSEYTGKQKGSRLDFSITQNSDIQLAGKAGSIISVEKTRNYAGIKFTIEFLANGDYTGTALNSTIIFNNKEFIETLQGGIVSFQLDVFEGFYGHNFFSSPGFYSFEFLDKPEFHSVSPSNPLVQADKNRAQNMRIDRPEGQQHFNLFIDKFTRRSSITDFRNEYNDVDGTGFVSLFNEHMVLLNGVVSYARPFFRFYGESVVPSGSVEVRYLVLPEFSPTWYTIVESNDPNNKVVLSLKDYNIYADALIETNVPVETPLFRAYFRGFNIYEIPASPITKRFLSWNKGEWPDVLRSLSSSGHPAILLNGSAYSFDLGYGNKFTIVPEISYEKNAMYEHPFLESVHKYMDKNYLCFNTLVPMYFSGLPGLKRTIPDWFASDKTLNEWLYEQERR